MAECAWPVLPEAWYQALMSAMDCRSTDFSNLEPVSPTSTANLWPLKPTVLR